MGIETGGPSPEEMGIPQESIEDAEQNREELENLINEKIKKKEKELFYSGAAEYFLATDNVKGLKKIDSLQGTDKESVGPFEDRMRMRKSGHSKNEAWINLSSPWKLNYGESNSDPETFLQVYDRARQFHEKVCEDLAEDNPEISNPDWQQAKLDSLHQKIGDERHSEFKTESKKYKPNEVPKDIFERSIRELHPSDLSNHEGHKKSLEWDDMVLKGFAHAAHGAGNLKIAKACYDRLEGN
jgi:hypothetical protein